MLVKKALPLVIASILASASVQAQGECVELEGTPPGMYATTDEGTTFLIQDGQIIELGPGESGFADKSGLKCIKKIPAFMDWPCSTDAARSRKFATYRIDDLAPENKAQQIVQRYFEVPEVIEPIPRWKNGEYHMKMSMDEILQFTSEEYWYHPAPARPITDPKRPQVLLISLFVGINAVVVDSHTLKSLHQEFGEEIPVAFLFNDSNVVPISYYGPNVSLEEVLTGNLERGINVAPPPMWELGDFNVNPSVTELNQFFDIPALADIPPERQAALKADLEENGFTRKPVFVSILSGSDKMVIDQPQRVAVAASMGMTNIPVNAMIVEPDVLVQRCGPGTPSGMGDSGAAISGETTPQGGATIPPGSVVTPPGNEVNASDS
jgi:hypothetical protein